MIRMRMARHDEVEAANPERGQLGRDLVLVGTAVNGASARLPER